MPCVVVDYAWHLPDDLPLRHRHTYLHFAQCLFAESLRESPDGDHGARSGGSSWPGESTRQQPTTLRVLLLTAERVGASLVVFRGSAGRNTRERSHAYYTCTGVPRAVK